MLAFLIVFLIFPLLPFSHSMLKVLLADVFSTAIVFFFSMILKNSSIYDPYWSVVPPVITIYLMKLFPEGDAVRQLVILALVLFWSIRLTFNWLRGWKDFSQQDWRYTSIAQKTGKWYWPVSFLGIHLMPTLFVFMGCLPLWYPISSKVPFGFYDLFATLFTLIAIGTEWLADEQLLKFRKSNSSENFMKNGLWSVSRHPNYLGEISYWAGLFLFVLSSGRLIRFDGVWTIIGLVSMIILFKFISIPLMEKRNKIRKSGYEVYIRHVPALFPGFILKNK